MVSIEVKDMLGRQRNEKRWTLIALLGSALLGAALVLLLSPGNTFEDYRAGDLCDTDCGRVGGNPLLCLRGEGGASYCARPCGDAFPGCPAGYECLQLNPEQIASISIAESAAKSYCFKVSASL